ncbi:MAG TPA: efflux RND transporter periplasmic adaptor subunit [Candidatus Binataceae bacterium]|nr:efflux RND transporter periplasmic adaptor subunit [Candidatus Binataceae bacterium]
MAQQRNLGTVKAGPLFSLTWIVVTLIVLTGLVALVRAREVRLQHQTQVLARAESLGPIVSIAPLQRGGEQRLAVYPGDVHGYFESPIYPKVSGYVKAVLVDKGTRVKAGQLLVVIESPELDRQVRAAEATYRLAVLTDRRNQVLLAQHVVSQQQADTSHQEMLADLANWQSLSAMKGYEQVTAPYAGIITARNVDPGALVAMATASQTTAMPVVTLARLDPVRVYVQMPQDDAALVQDGDPAVVTVSQLPGREFQGKVTRNAGALVNGSRTMLVEVDLANPDFILRPGMYAEVRITLSSNSSMPLVPDDAVVYENGKIFVPVVKDDRVHLVQVALGYDDGLRSEVIRGLKGNEMIALTLGQSAQDGELVQPLLEHPAR